MRYNEENTKEKEKAGRSKYLNNWIEYKGDCKHFCFTEERWCPVDAFFHSGGTQICVADIKDRKYSYAQLMSWGVMVDADKAREVKEIAASMNAIPLIITCTNDGKFIISDLRFGKQKDLSWKWEQSNDNDHEKIYKEMINLSGCTII